MIKLNTEFYSSPYYFWIKNREDHYSIILSSEQTISEAKKNVEVVTVPKEHIEKVMFYLKKLIGSGKKKNTKEVKGEIEELVNVDGTFSNSKIPILDPRLHPRKTMDQTVAMASITNDPISRGYRTYYGESIEEVDLSKAFGYKETKNLTPIQTVKKLKKMRVDDPIGRADEFGKSIKIKQNKKRKGSKMKIRLVEKQKLDEIQKEKMVKMVEDILAKRKENNSDIRKKETKPEDIPSIIRKNLKTLLKQSEKYGLTKSEIIKMMKDES